MQTGGELFGSSQAGPALIHAAHTPIVIGECPHGVLEAYRRVCFPLFRFSRCLSRGTLGMSYSVIQKSTARSFFVGPVETRRQPPTWEFNSHQ